MPDRLRHSLYYIVNTLPCAPQKVKCFSVVKTFSAIHTKRKRPLPGKIGKEPVDKWRCLWFNDIHIQHKDIDGKLAYAGCHREPAVGASRSGGHERSDSRVGFVNGQGSVMKPGCPRYRDRACWSLKGFPRFWGDNQGGTANL